MPATKAIVTAGVVLISGKMIFLLKDIGAVQKNIRLLYNIISYFNCK